MASAAAVGANAARTPPQDENTIEAPENALGTVTSGIYARDEAPPLSGDGSPERDDVEGAGYRRAHAERPPVEDGASEAGVGDGDLFGDDADDDGIADKSRRLLDDEELDSGDDDGRSDRVTKDDVPGDTVNVDRIEMDIELERQPVPEPSDGEMYLLKVPRFLGIEPVAYSHTRFQPPVTDHHSRGAPSATFSAYNTALSTIRWRRSPSNHSQLQSNARVLRWSDGSLTLQLASDPQTQYEIDGNPLAPPQRHAPKPTPTSNVKYKSKVSVDGGTYNPKLDSFTYLALPSSSAQLLRITNKITCGLSVLPTASSADDALERLQNSLAAAHKNKSMNGEGGIEFVPIHEDPELAKKKAEVAEKERERAAKRRENAAMRERERSGRTLGRHGLSSSRLGGLNAAMLEDDELGMGVSKPKAGKAKPRRQRRANSEYSEDEDFGRKRGNREDEYDEEDEFIAASDEEEEAGGSDDDEDPNDGIVEDRQSKKDRARSREASVAGGEADDGTPVQARAKRRRVVDDEDEE
ncbi:hypothetical protein LTR66_009647 [Elasticomyces elasticus]|nr:hypothetical protein LTR66_009647 [Elasticomyces elasticus]